MTSPRRNGRRQRVLAGLLVAIALALLLGTVVLSASMVAQTSDLGGKVKLTESIVDGNVRTLSQVQRELLRLDVLLALPHPTPEATSLQRSLVDQRIQEGTLSYQEQTLGSDSLLDRSRALARRWRTEVRPSIDPAVASDSPGSLDRARARTAIQGLELGYNQLVSDGEINRKLEADRANDETKLMLVRAHRLLAGLVITFVTVLLSLVLGGVAYARFHRQRERESRELEELNKELVRYAHVVRSTDNIVAVADADGHLEWVNEAFERVTGLSREDVGSGSVLDLLTVAGADEQTVDRIRQGLADGGDGFKDDLVLRLADGREVCLSVDASPVHDEREQRTGFVAVANDVTERRRAEQLVVAAKESAEEVAREKATFLASMSHEIRTPLNAVLGLTDLLLVTDLDSQQREYVRTAHSSGRLLLALVNDILDFSALETGRIELEERPFTLGEMLRDTTEMFSADAGGRGVDLRLDLSPGLPTHVRGDETRLRQILVNLLGNGLKFTESGTVVLSAGTVPSSGGDAGPAVRDGEVRLRLAVADTGIGIPAERISRLFHPFTQVDPSTTRKYGGTGLGLAICRLLVDQMNGTIDVVSELGAGSTFAVEVTLAQASGSDAQDGRPTDERRRSRDLAGLRVLVAEDDKVNQTVAVHMLRRLGIEPTVVDDGRAAVAQVLENDYDVVLMDIHMPTMDGVEATERIRAQVPFERQPLLVAMTANALDGDRERLLAGGMDGYISKPFMLADLAGTLGLAQTRPTVDARAFAARTGITAPAVLTDLVAGLMATVGRQTEEIDEQITADALEDAAGLADEIASVARACEIVGVHRAALALRRAVRDGDRAGALARLEDLRRALAEVASWLDRRHPAGVSPS